MQCEGCKTLILSTDETAGNQYGFGLYHYDCYQELTAEIQHEHILSDAELMVEPV